MKAKKLIQISSLFFAMFSSQVLANEQYDVRLDLEARNLLPISMEDQGDSLFCYAYSAQQIYLESLNKKHFELCSLSSI